MQVTRSFAVFAIAVFLSSPSFAFASEAEQVIEQILTITPRDDLSISMSEKAREAALEEAAYTYGARYGNYWRSRQIADRVARYSRQLEIFSFDTVMLEDSGYQIQPPVASITRDAFKISEDGQSLATAKEVINILDHGKLVTAVPSWETYLEFSVEEPETPPSAVFPTTDDERIKWEHWIRAGFKDGIEQADYVFEDKLEQLLTDFTGMITWQVLYAEGKATRPEVIVNTTAVSGGGKTMRIGESVISITDPSKLNPIVQDWAPIIVENRND